MTLVERLRLHCTPARRRRIHAAACVGAWCLYALTFAPLYRATGPGVTALVSIPVLLTAWLFGTLAGVASGLVAWIVTSALLALVAGPTVLAQSVVRHACPAGALLLTAAAIGRLRTLRDRLARQVIEQRLTEQALERRTALQLQLLESARQLTESIHLSETLSRIAGHARDMLASHGCGIYRLSPDGAMLLPLVVIEPTRESTAVDRPLRVDHSYTGRAVLACHALVFNDVVTSPPDDWLPRDPPEPTERLIAAPLSVEGQTLGAICLSRIGEPYGSEDLAACEALAAYAAIALRNASLYQDLQREALERRSAETALERSERMFRSVIEQSVDGIVLVDDAGRVLVWNAGVERITGIPRAEAVGARLADVQFSLVLDHQRTAEARAQLEEMQQAFLRTGNAPWLGRPVEREIQSRDGALHAVQSIVFPIVTDGQRMYGSINRDVTEQRRAERLIEASLREKDVLLREVHHRVKNNLQIVASLLELQGDDIRDPEALIQLAEGQQRIRTMALIHETLYRSADLASVDLAEYVAVLADQLCASYGVDPDRVQVTVDIADARLGIDMAIPCGLIINELASNSLKHAFPAGRTGRVCVAMRRVGAGVELTVTDDGVGLPPGLDFRATTTLGLQLVTLLAAQLHGSIDLLPGQGTTFRVTFPLSEPEGDGAAHQGALS